MVMKRDEEDLHIAICIYIKLQYRKVYFLSDASGLKLPIGLAVKFHKMHSKNAQLDIVILEPNKSYYGLILEIKKNRMEVFKKNGNYRNNKHVIKQLKSIVHLESIGYRVTYVFCFDHAKLIIDDYMNNK